MAARLLEIAHLSFCKGGGGTQSVKAEGGPSRVPRRLISRCFLIFSIPFHLLIRFDFCCRFSLMPPRCQNRKIRSGSVTLLRPSIFSMRNIQKIHAPSRKIFPKNHCYFSGSRIYWEVYRSSLPAPQAGELSSCTAASGGKQAGKAILPSPPFFAVFLFCRYSYFQRWHCSVFSLSRLCYRSGTCAFGTAAGPAFALLRLL